MSASRASWPRQRQRQTAQNAVLALPAVAPQSVLLSGDQAAVVAAGAVVAGIALGVALARMRARCSRTDDEWIPPNRTEELRSLHDWQVAAQLSMKRSRLRRGLDGCVAAKNRDFPARPHDDEGDAV